MNGYQLFMEAVIMFRASATRLPRCNFCIRPNRASVPVVGLLCAMVFCAAAADETPRGGKAVQDKPASPRVESISERASAQQQTKEWRRKRELLLVPFLREEMEESVQGLDVDMDWGDLASIKVHGEFQERIDRSIARLISLRPEVVMCNLDLYGPDFAGRWIDVMCLLNKYTRKDYGIASIVGDMLGNQKPEGQIEGPKMPFLFGHKRLPVYDYAPWKAQEFEEPGASEKTGGQFDVGRWWGQGRGLVGLLEYYKLSKDNRALKGAMKLGDFHFHRFPLGQTYVVDSFEDYYLGVLEGLVMLWEVTKEKRYLAVARAIGERVSENSLYDPKVTIGVQTHTFLTARRGLLRLYLATRDEKYLQGVIRAHREMEKVAWVTGGIVEVFDERIHTEACSTADWLRLNLQLWRITREPKYLDIAEMTLLNQIYLEQLPNGGFSNGTTLANGGTPGLEMRYCCTEHGARAFCDVLKAIYTVSGQEIWVNLFFDSEATLTLSGGTKVSIRQRTTYPGKGLINLEVLPQEKARFKVKVRIPSFSQLKAVHVNNQKVKYLCEDQYLTVERDWQPKDVLSVKLGLSVRSVTKNYGQPIVSSKETDDKEPFANERVFIYGAKGIPTGERSAVVYGPLVLKVDQESEDVFVVNKELAKAILKSNSSRKSIDKSK